MGQITGLAPRRPLPLEPRCPSSSANPSQSCWQSSRCWPRAWGSARAPPTWSSTPPNRSSASWARWPPTSSCARSCRRELGAQLTTQITNSVPIPRPLQGVLETAITKSGAALISRSGIRDGLERHHRKHAPGLRGEAQVGRRNRHARGDAGTGPGAAGHLRLRHAARLAGRVGAGAAVAAGHRRAAGRWSTPTGRRRTRCRPARRTAGSRLPRAGAGCWRRRPCCWPARCSWPRAASAAGCSLSPGERPWSSRRCSSSSVPTCPACRCRAPSSPSWWSPSWPRECRPSCRSSATR